MLRFLQNQTSEYRDPRSELIPRAPDVDGGFPDGDASGVGDVSGSIDTSGLGFGGDFWANLFGGDFWGWLLGFGGLGAFLAGLWSFYTFLAYLISLLFIVMYIYATIKMEYYDGLITQGLRDEEKKWNQLHKVSAGPSRLDDVYAHADSENPNDWKLAIIEADIVLDQTLKERGYIGDSLGERLRSITPSQMSTIDDAWEAHVVRNKIAHEGADFVLTKRIADETVQRYRRVFAELDVR